MDDKYAQHFSFNQILKESIPSQLLVSMFEKTALLILQTNILNHCHKEQSFLPIGNPNQQI